MDLIFYQEDIAAIFSKADENNSGTLKVDDFKGVIKDIAERYPQVQIHLKKNQLRNFLQLLKSKDGEDELNIEKFKQALAEVDKQMKSLPPTAQVSGNWKGFFFFLGSVADLPELSFLFFLMFGTQVASQQGVYLADCFNRMDICEKYLEGPIRFRAAGRHRFRPFR